jgi:putative Holliday junction resolvase
MKVLALDHGEKRIGLAIGDAETKLALPYGLINNESDELVLEQLQKIILEEDVNVVLVGEPLSTSGAASKQTEASRKFANFLKTNLNISVELFDERFTSQRADAAPRDLKTRSRDEMAAMFLLQDYLDRNI